MLNRWRLPRRICAALLGMTLIGASAQEQRATSDIPEPPECLEEAAAFHRVNAWVLRAIIWHESRNNPTLVLRNKNGSLDIGYGGINSIHWSELGRFDVDPSQLRDACVNTYVAAWLLAKKMAKYGDSWDAIGAYHSETPDKKAIYVGHIRRILIRWRVIAP